MSAKEVACFFWEQIICGYGAVQMVVTHNGSETKGALELLVTKYGIYDCIYVESYRHWIMY